MHAYIITKSIQICRGYYMACACIWFWHRTNHKKINKLYLPRTPEFLTLFSRPSPAGLFLCTPCLFCRKDKGTFLPLSIDFDLRVCCIYWRPYWLMIFFVYSVPVFTTSRRWALQCHRRCRFKLQFSRIIPEFSRILSEKISKRFDKILTENLGILSENISVRIRASVPTSENMIFTRNM